MQNKKRRESLAEKQYYIDKTDALKRGIEIFPSIYVEGAAASGKTTAVKMLLAGYPDVTAHVLDMTNENDALMHLSELMAVKEDGIVWYIFENLTADLTATTVNAIVECICNLDEGCRAVLIGRKRPAEEFLNLIWKRQMEIIPQETLRFTEEEIRGFVKKTGSRLDSRKIYEETGGWAGCVDLLIRMSEKESASTARTVQELMQSYEIRTYINRNIIDTLSKEEREIMRRSAMCPWLDVELCQEVWGISGAAEVLIDLQREGLLIFDKKKQRWKTEAMFRSMEWNHPVNSPSADIFWRYLGAWHNAQGNIREALHCLKQISNGKAYRKCIEEHYSEVPLLGICYSDVMKWKEYSPELCYLRGMYCYTHQDLVGLEQEIQRLNVEGSETENMMGTYKVREIYLNLMYLKSDVELDEWLNLLEKYTEDGEKMKLYNVMGNSFVSLCGVRDLAKLFACLKREENRKARIWKTYLGEDEWKWYQMARVDYYLETERGSSILKEDREVLLKEDSQTLSWQQGLAKLYLLCKLQTINSGEENQERIHGLEETLAEEENPICVHNAEAVSSLYSPWRKEHECLLKWLRYVDMEGKTEVSEGNYMVRYCQVRGYLHLKQYDRADKILNQLIPYLKLYHRNRLLAEVLFEKAIVCWNKNRHGQALQNIIESFLVTGDSHYVGFYTSYEKKGMEVLEAYVDWLSKNTPGGWHRKKKYNYGNVLRMPQEEYMGVILRCAKRGARTPQYANEAGPEEHLTMMETIILQDIARGLSNAEICTELQLKLPTVKSHLYSLYKKLGVSSRVQAVIKGKELGILE